MKSPLLGDDSNKLDPSLRSVTYANGKVTSEPALKLAKMKNTICNQKYNVFTFVPRVLYDQFKYFFNMFYLVIAISQFIPVLSVGLLFSYVAPLVLVLLLTMVKEGYEDYQRFVKDKEANGAMYNTLGEGGALFSK
jgi:phospholipid-translocating ATPase